MVMSLALLCWSLILGFVPCEFGKRMNDAFVEINDSMDQFDWHIPTKEFVKMLLIILVTVQQPVEIVCMGSITCNREAFTKVSCQNSVQFSSIFLWELLSKFSLALNLISDCQIRFLLFHGTSVIWKRKRLAPLTVGNQNIENYDF